MKIPAPPPSDDDGRRPIDVPNFSIWMTPAIRSAIQRVAAVLRREDVQLFLATGRKLRADADRGSARAKRRWRDWAKKEALQGFEELGPWLKQLVPLRGRGDDGYAAKDDETLKDMFAAVEAGSYPSPNAAMRAYISDGKFKRGGTVDSTISRLRRRPLYKAMMQKRRQAVD